MTANAKITITNNEARILQVQLAHAQLPSKGIATSTSTGKLLELRPGVNEVDAADWAEAKKMRTVRGWIETRSENPEMRGAMMVVEGRTVAGDRPAISAYKGQALTQLLEDTFDVALLRAWLVDEQRVEARKMIERRIADVERAGERAAAASTTTPPAA